MKLSCHRLQIGIAGGLFEEPLEWQVNAGECWGILGTNGCGKSTLLRTIAGLLPAREGSIEINDRDLKTIHRQERARIIGLLSQESTYNFPMRVKDVVISGRYPYQPWFGKDSQTDKQVAKSVMQQVGIEALQQRLVNTLSGGEARKVAMATLLCQSPQLALLDEPENHLDPGIRYQLLQRMKLNFHAHGQALVMVLHDPSMALRLCSHLLLIDPKGNVKAGKNADVATTENLSHAYAHPMILLEDNGERLVYPG